MALSEDQKAMLRLLAQREQGYGDIAALMGLGVEDVRARVRDSLAALDGGLTGDQKAMLRLLAQREEGYDDIAALTGGDVDGVRAKVRAALAELGAEQKAAEKPPVPDSKPAAAASPKPATKATRNATPKLKLPQDEGARRALIAGAAIVAVIVLLLVTGVLGGGDDGSGSTTTASSAAGESALEGEGGTPTANGKEPTQALLAAVDGSDARGRALFGREGQKVVMLLGAKGLSPAPQGQSYTVSLVRSSSERLPLVATKATGSGVISGRFQIAPQVLGLLAGGFDTMELSLVPDGELRSALKQARTAKKAPNYGGTTILEGPVTGPIVEAGEEG